MEAMLSLNNARCCDTDSNKESYIIGPPSYNLKMCSLLSQPPANHLITSASVVRLSFIHLNDS